MGIIYAAIIVFGITTIIGFYLSSLVLRHKETPKGLIVIHGLFSIAGFILLAQCYPESLKSILFFSFATASGLILCYQDLTGKKFFKWLCFVHGFLTLAGMVFLIVIALAS